MTALSELATKATLALAVSLVSAGGCALSVHASGNYPSALETQKWGPEKDERRYFTVPAVNSVLNGGMESAADYPATISVDTHTDTPAGTENPRDDFRVFNAMLYKGMPANFGEKTTVVYEQSFYEGTTASEDGTPSDEGIRNAVQNALKQSRPPISATGNLSIMDVERWPVWPFVTADAHKASIKHYASTLDRFGRALGTDVCAYAIAPQAGINHANLALRDPAVRQQWTGHSNVTRDLLVPHADALCPSLYAYYTDADGSGRQVEYWKNFAIETIREARRIAQGKPVYPFIWPQFHRGGGVIDSPYLPASYWRVIVETVRDNADGVVLWGGYDIDEGGQLQWDDSAEWVSVVRKALKL